MQLVRDVRSKLTPCLFVDAQLIGQAIEGLDQGADFVGAAAWLRQCWRKRWTAG